jgi:hypothetical protein
MDLEAACRAASKAAAQIDARIKTKLVKRALKHGMTDENEVLALAEEWKQAARMAGAVDVQDVLGNRPNASIGLARFSEYQSQIA